MAYNSRTIKNERMRFIMLNRSHKGASKSLLPVLTKYSQIWSYSTKTEKRRIFFKFWPDFGCNPIVVDIEKNKKPSRDMVEHDIKIGLKRKNNIQGVFKKIKIKKKCFL